MSRLLFLAAAVVLLGIISFPLLLSRRYSDSDRYKGELAAWHVRWGEAASLEERKSLVEELARIQPPLGSVSALSRHRHYVRAHELAALSDGASDSLIEQVRMTPGLGQGGPAFSCETLAEFSGDASRILLESGVRMESVKQVCEVRAVARSQLADVRGDALLDWLKDEIRALEPASSSR
jgi:hypothetical protein